MFREENKQRKDYHFFLVLFLFSVFMNRSDFIKECTICMLHMIHLQYKKRGSEIAYFYPSQGLTSQSKNGLSLIFLNYFFNIYF